MYTDDHGGACCGLSHLHEFPARADIDLVKRKIERELVELSRAAAYDYEGADEKIPWKVFGHAIEVVLTDAQMQVWSQDLKKFGFKLCYRWKNDNSGNHCNLLMWSSKKTTAPKPYKW